MNREQKQLAKIRSGVKWGMHDYKLNKGWRISDRAAEAEGHGMGLKGIALESYVRVVTNRTRMMKDVLGRRIKEEEERQKEEAEFDKKFGGTEPVGVERFMEDIASGCYYEYENIGSTLFVTTNGQRFMIEGQAWEVTGIPGYEPETFRADMEAADEEGSGWGRAELPKPEVDPKVQAFETIVNGVGQVISTYWAEDL